MVEFDPSKVAVVGSIPISRSILTMEEFYGGAEPCDLFERVTQEIDSSVIDEYNFRQNKTWSILGHQVIGAEVY